MHVNHANEERSAAVRVADLGVCAPSGTRTPNPLKLAERLLAALAMALTCAVTCAFAPCAEPVVTRVLGGFALMEVA